MRKLGYLLACEPTVAKMLFALLLFVNSNKTYEIWVILRPQMTAVKVTGTWRWLNRNSKHAKRLLIYFFDQYKLIPKH